MRMMGVAMDAADRISLLQTFIRIVESGSLSAAARQLRTTQPTVSRRLKALEALLGVELIKRTTHAMKLTDDGERCYRHARAVSDGWSALRDDLSGGEEEPQGLLRVRAPHAFGQDQLIGPLTELLFRHGGLSVDWVLNDRSPNFMADNIDCAVLVGETTDPASVVVPIGQVPRIVVAAPSLLARHGPVTGPEDLATLPWLALSTFYRAEVALHRCGGQETRRFAIQPRFATDSLYAVHRVALTGLGAAVVSRWAVLEDLAAGRLVHLAPDWQADPLPVHLVYPYASYYPVRLRAFLRMIRQEMPKLL